MTDQHHTITKMTNNNHSHLENLYVLIADLQSEVNQLKKDNEFLKSYIWEHCSEIEALKEWSEDAQKYYD